MVSDQVRDDGSIADLPWAAAFDPAANARVLSSVQARGFRAATEVVNRFVRLAEEGLAGSGASDGPAATPARDVDRVLSAWQKLADQLTRSLAGTGAMATQTDPAKLDLANATSSGHLVLDADSAGAVSSEVWLHNGGAADMGKVRLRCSDLLSHDGALISSAMVRFEPDTVPMFARSSRGVTVQIDVGDDVAPGCYRGTLMADGHADVWLPIALTVRSPDA